MRLRSFLSALLGIVCGFGVCCRTWSGELPRVGIIGRYQEQYDANYRDAGCELVQLKEADLLEGDLAKYRMIHFAHWTKIPDAVQKRVAEYVKTGGTALYTFGSMPAAEFFGGVAPERLEGKTAGIRIDASAVDFFAGVPEKLAAQGWGFSLAIPPSMPEAEIMAWYEPPAEGSTVEVHPPFRVRRPAIARIRYGKGQVFFCGGCAVGYPLDRVLKTLVNRVMPETNPLLDFVTSLEGGVPIAPNAENLTGEVVGIFREEGFPRVGVPSDLTPEFIFDALKNNGITAEFVDAAGLERLDPQKYNSLILSYGESFPVTAYDSIKRYIAAGGGIVSPAGIPLAEPVRLEGGIWKKIIGPSHREQWVYALFKYILPIAKYQDIPAGAARTFRFDSGVLPEDLPLEWPGCTGVAFQPVPAISFRPQMPLLGTVNESGVVLALPLLLHPADGKFPAARLVALGLTGERHPWSPAWEHAPRVIAELTRLALRRDWRMLVDFYTDLPLYEPGETIRVKGAVRTRRSGTASVCVALYDRESDRAIEQRKLELALRPGDTPFELEFSIPETGESFDLVASLEGDCALPQRAMALVRRPGKEMPSGPEFAFREGRMTIDGVPTQLSGVNFYNNEDRSLGVFVPGRGNPRRLPDVWERDLAWIRLAGGNSTRQHYLEDMFLPDSFDPERRDDPATDFALRTLDACRYLHAKAGTVMLLDPLTFLPGTRKLWLPLKLDGGNPYTDSAPREAVRYYLKGLTEYCAGSGNIAWELINEPEHISPRTLGTAPEAIRSWVKEMGAVFGAPFGIGNAVPENSRIWNIRENLNGVISWGHVHPYYEELLRLDGFSNIAFAMNFSRPALMGEVGLPNASSSGRARLGNWGHFYENLLALGIGEEAAGFQNFYLGYAMWNDSPEWGLLLPQMVERESFKVWKTWNFVRNRLSESAVLPPETRLIYRTDTRDEVLRKSYTTLVNRGIRTWVMSDRELELNQDGVTAAAGVRTALLLYEDAEREWLNEWSAKLKRAGIRVVALKKSEAEATLRKLSLSSPGGVTRSGCESDYFYVLPRRDGTRTIVAAECSGKRFGLRVGSYRYFLEPVAGSTVVLEVERSGAPRLLQATGRIECNGKLLFENRNPGPAAIAAPDGETLPATQSALLHADDPGLVTTSVKLASELPAGAVFSLTGDPVSEEMRALFATVLQENGRTLAAEGGGIPVKIVRHSELTQQGEGLLLRGGVWPEVRYGNFLRWYEPWSALITFDGRSLTLRAGTDGALASALLRIARSKQLGNVSVGPGAWLPENALR